MRLLRSLGAAGLLLRRLRSERSMVAVICVVVAATSFLLAAAPRLLNRATDEALRYAVGIAAPSERDVTMSLTARISAQPGSGSNAIRAYGDSVARQLPASVSALVAARIERFTTVQLFVPQPPIYETHLSLRYQDGLPEATNLVAGRWPVDLGQGLQPIEYGADPETKPELVVVEAALSSATAAEIGVGVGDRIPVTIDGSDQIVRGLGFQLGPTAVEVVGLFEPVDSQAAYWAGDTELLKATIRGTDDRPVAYATAYVAGDAYPALAASGLPFHFAWRFQVDPERLDAGNIEQLAVDLQRLGFITGPATGPGDGALAIVTGLPRVIERVSAQRAQSESVLSIAAVGPFGLAGGAVAMLALLLLRQRRSGLVLARGRGASGVLVLATQLWEAGVFILGAALVGLLTALALVDGRPSALSLPLAIGAGVMALALVVGASWPLAIRPLGALEREDVAVLRVEPRRLVIELTIVAVAVGAAFLLQQRGLAVEAPGVLVQADPFLAAVPVLAGLAAGILVLRLFPVPVLALGWLAARRRDLVPVLGLRNIGRHPAAANLPLLVLMLTAAFGAFSSVVASSLDRGQVVASYLQVGADYRLERIGAGVLDPSLHPEAIPGVEAVAPGLIDRAAAFAARPSQHSSIYLMAVDPAAYDAVTAGLPAEPSWPADFFAPREVAGLGTDANPIPAIVSSTVPAGTGGLEPGQTFRMTIAGYPMTFVLVDRRAAFAGIPTAFAFAVVPFDWIQDALPSGFLPPSEFWLRAPAGIAEPLAAAVAAAGNSTRVVSRHDAYALLRDAPLTAVIGTGYRAALVAAAMYMAVTFVGALILTSARRSRADAFLRSLGVTGQQALGLTILEHALPAALAILPGLALGIGVAILTEPGLGLATFVGASGVPLFVDWSAVGVLVGSLAGLVALAVVAGTWLSRRMRPAQALRVDDD
jgi:putative ABC transport system permease protein